MPARVDEMVSIGVERGRIVLVGPDTGAGTVAAASGFEVVDLGGRFVVPGLWDNHVHFSQLAAQADRLDVSGAASAAETAALVRERLRVATPAPGRALIGYGFRDALWPDVPTKRALDQAAARYPVVLVSGDLHCCWLNGAALELYGFSATGLGVLREDECFELTAALETVSDEVLDARADDCAQAAAARGVVGIVDLEMEWNASVWKRRIARGTDVLRVDFGVYTDHLERAIAAGMRTGDVIAGTKGLLRVGPFKVFTDGSLNTRTAYCVDGYPGMAGSPGVHGINVIETGELIALMRAASDAGITPTVHAIGDLANRQALDAFEILGCAGSIEHAQLIADVDLPRFAALGVTASVQPEHAMDDRDVTDRYWAGRTDRAFAYRSLADAGARLVFGSDAPVAPLDPWGTMAAAVFRARDGREPWHPEQTLSAEAALSASTRSRIAVGEVADLAVVELDPFSASETELRQMPVAATMLGGRFTYDALR